MLLAGTKFTLVTNFRSIQCQISTNNLQTYSLDANCQSHIWLSNTRHHICQILHLQIDVCAPTIRFNYINYIITLHTALEICHSHLLGCAVDLVWDAGRDTGTYAKGVCYGCAVDLVWDAGRDTGTYAKGVCYGCAVALVRDTGTYAKGVCYGCAVALVWDAGENKHPGLCGSHIGLDHLNFQSGHRDQGCVCYGCAANVPSPCQHVNSTKRNIVVVTTDLGVIGFPLTWAVRPLWW